MKLQGKKNVKGKDVVIFDTEGMTIAELVPEMIDEGWAFDQLLTTYTNNSGQKVRKPVSPASVPSVYQKHPQLTKWSFTAANGDATVQGTIDCSKGAVVITRSTNGGIKFFANLGSSYVPADAYPEPEQVSYAEPYAEPAQGQPRYYAQPDAAPAQPAVADTPIAQRNMERREGVAAPADPDTKGMGKPIHFIPYVFIAIVLMICLSPIPFSIFSLIELKHAHDEPDYELAYGHIKTARTLLIGGFVAGILMILLMVALFGFPKLPFLPS